MSTSSHRFISRWALVPALALLMLGAAQAQHAGHGAAHGSNAAPDSAATQAFKAANEKMHRNMDIPFTGNADKDFLAGMIAHHQGAIDMAEVELQHGKDQRVRKLAEEVIRAQKGEIEQMRAWLQEMK